jgi:hypothetical protein
MPYLLVVSRLAAFLQKGDSVETLTGDFAETSQSRRRARRWEFQVLSGTHSRHSRVRIEMLARQVGDILETKWGEKISQQNRETNQHSSVRKLVALLLEPDVHVVCERSRNTIKRRLLGRQDD